MSYDTKTKNNHANNIMPFNCTARHSVFIVALCLTVYIFFQIPFLHTLLSTSYSSSSLRSWPPMMESTAEKLRHSVTFLPLKDIRYTGAALQGNTWFMSSMKDTQEEDDVKYQHYPSEASKGRILCIKGHDTHDGSWNYYGLAWPEALPHNATLRKGLTFVSYNHYDYANIWHGLAAVFPFVRWHMKNDCKVPSRWVLYHWGELRTIMSLWLELHLKATFGVPVNIEVFEGVEDEQPVCFEEAVVMRHGDGGMSRQRRMETYDLLRCKARLFCNLTSESHTVSFKAVTEQTNDHPIIGMTMFMRTGGRSFINDTAVIDIFRSECDKFEGCRLTVAYSNNLTFCEQVELMSITDILVSPHGAQLTNQFLMDRNSSVMEFFPKGWLKLAGVGQYVYHWLASWSGMQHQGAYRDPNGVDCPYPEDDRRCMPIFKNGQIGHNETYFREWAINVLNQVKIRKVQEASSRITSYGSSTSTPCGCS